MLFHWHCIRNMSSVVWPAMEIPEFLHTHEQWSPRVVSSQSPRMAVSDTACLLCIINILKLINTVLLLHNVTNLSSHRQ